MELPDGSFAQSGLLFERFPKPTAEPQKTTWRSLPSAPFTPTLSRRLPISLLVKSSAFTHSPRNAPMLKSLSPSLYENRRKPDQDRQIVRHLPNTLLNRRGGGSGCRTLDSSSNLLDGVCGVLRPRWQGGNASKLQLSKGCGGRTSDRRQCNHWSDNL
jgi:hypothetical protein